MSMASLLPMVLNAGVKMYSGLQGGEAAADAARTDAQARARAGLAEAAQVRSETARRVLLFDGQIENRRAILDVEVAHIVLLRRLHGGAEAHEHGR